MKTESTQQETSAPQPGEPPPWLAGGGVCGERVRATDWAATPLGPPETWPSSLKTTVGIILHSRHPMFLWWGPELIQIYNDAYLPSFGRGKHPAAMGQPGRLCWGEIWDIIWPQIDAVMRCGRASWNEDQLVPIFRNGRIEEVFWTYGYSPVFDGDRIAGTLVVCTETTSRVVAQRRLETLRLLAEETAPAMNLGTLLRATAEVFSGAVSDLAFALVYLRPSEAAEPRLAECIGLSQEEASKAIDAAFWHRLDALDPHDVQNRPALALAEGGLDLPDHPWSERIAEAFVAPFLSGPEGALNGFIVFGLNPRLSLDGGYRSYLLQLAESLSLTAARITAMKSHVTLVAERTNLLLQAPVATALMTGPEHTFQLANSLFCELAGRKDLIGKTYLQAFPELKNTPISGILDRVYQSGVPFITNEMLVPLARSSDGAVEDCFVRFNLEPMREPLGTVYGMMAVAVDITEQVRARHVLEKAQIEREKLLVELKSANLAKDEFLAMLGHELRNPLSPIVTALELMKLRGESGSAKERGIIERQVKHVIRLVDDLLDVAKITSGKVELQHETLEIADALLKAVEIASPLFEQRGHQLDIQVPRRGLPWRGDPVRLAQVVANLLTNAARYTDPGGRVRLSAYRHGNEIVVTVKDNGRGIPAELLPRIFDLFVQGKRSADRAEGGLGLGLALVKSLVALHGGSVVAASEGLGRGSEFVIKLPISGTPDLAGAAEAETLPRLTGSAGKQPVPRRVLLVEDNADAAALLSELLRAVGHEVAVASDPLIGLKLFDEFDPEIAILDIGLPVMDGYELAARVRARNRTPRCRLIALTGYGQEHDRARSEQAGFDSHIVKPVDMETLLRSITEPGVPD